MHPEVYPGTGPVDVEQLKHGPKDDIESESHNTHESLDDYQHYELDQGHPHFRIDHQDPRLQEVKQSLDDFLRGYSPAPQDRDSMSFQDPKLYENGGEWQRTHYSWIAGEEPVETHSTVSSEELQEQNNRYLKFAANRLRDIVEYAVSHKMEILVNPPDFEIIKVPLQEGGSDPPIRIPKLMTVYA